ncbi:MAG TPA: exodeoxyribonuclease V subunit alpha [Polyangiaceae bacterium]|nr:exodeoxyribonuclease V subunit alpha [Polyangiaceae bacterium]
MKRLSPLGTARERFAAARSPAPPGARDAGEWAGADDDALEPRYFGWEIARCAPGLDAQERRALGSLAAACLVCVRSGSTRLSLEDAALGAALAVLGGPEVARAAAALVARARRADPRDPITAVVGRAGERKPLVIDGSWLYPERMRALEERFCARVRDRMARAAEAYDARSIRRALAAVAQGPPPLTDEQGRAVREALTAPLALVTGGPGTGKTTIVVSVLRALSWMGVRSDAVAIAAPTGKAAQRLREAISAGLGAAPRDMAEAALLRVAPAPQTLHRLLGWSPATGRFARHENDRLAHRVVVVDEASMVDLAMMDRLFRALADDARLVLLGDADQLPSVEAGAVFRDLCAGIGAVRLTENLRVGRDPGAQRIVAAARAINGGELDGRFADAVAARRAVGELTFQAIEHLTAPWQDVADDLVDRWWRERVACLDGFARLAGRTYRARGGVLDAGDVPDLRALFESLARARLLCATRTSGPASADALNRRLLERLAAEAPPGRGSPAGGLLPGAPVIVERNDYDRQLYNGDQGVVVRVDAGDGARPEPMAVFAQGDAWITLPLGAAAHLTPAFAMTVHKAQGSEFDDVALVLPEVDLPLVTRELVYTAVTRARRSVLLVGSRDLLARAVSRSVDRHTGVAEKLVDSK